MIELEQFRRLVGHDVQVEWRGTRTSGRLLNVSRRSLWLVHDDQDTMIPLAQVAALRPAS
jgi:ribosome maturation factor RimP